MDRFAKQRAGKRCDEGRGGLYEVEEDDRGLAGVGALSYERPRDDGDVRTKFARMCHFSVTTSPMRPLQSLILPQAPR